MFARSNDKWGGSFLFSFVVVNLIRLELLQMMGYKMIFCKRYEICSIPMPSISQHSCTEQTLLNITGWGYIFSFLLSFWSSLVPNWRCGWWWFGCNDFLMNPLKWCWLWDWHPMIWFMRIYWWQWHPLSLYREVDMCHSKCWIQNWKNDSGFFCGSSKELWSFEKYVFGSVTIFQWW